MNVFIPLLTLSLYILLTGGATKDGPGVSIKPGQCYQHLISLLLSLYWTFLYHCEGR